MAPAPKAVRLALSKPPWERGAADVSTVHSLLRQLPAYVALGGGSVALAPPQKHVCDHVLLEDYAPGMQVWTAGQSAACFYVVAAGVISLVLPHQPQGASRRPGAAADTEIVQVYRPGEVLGEGSAETYEHDAVAAGSSPSSVVVVPRLLLQQAQERMAAPEATQEAELARVRAILTVAPGMRSKSEVAALLGYCSSMPFFMELQLSVRREVCRRMLYATADTLSLLCRQGDPAFSFHVVLSGAADIHVHPNGRPELSHPDQQSLDSLEEAEERLGEQVFQLAPGSSFGEKGLSGVGRNASIVATEPVELLTLSKEDYDQVLRSTYETLEFSIEACQQAVRVPPEKRVQTDVQTLTQVLGKLAFFEQLPAHVTMQLCRLVTLREVDAGEVVFHQRDLSHQLMIVLTGTLTAFSIPNNRIADFASHPQLRELLGVYAAGDSFGGAAGDLQLESETIVITAKSQCELLILSDSDFERLAQQISGGVVFAPTQCRTALTKQPSSRSPLEVFHLAHNMKNLLAFRSMPLSVLEQLAKSTSYAIYADGDIIVEEGAPAGALFVVLSGFVSVRQAGRTSTGQVVRNSPATAEANVDLTEHVYGRCLVVAGVGDGFGQATHGRTNASCAVALGATEVLIIPREVYERHVPSDTSSVDTEAVREALLQSSPCARSEEQLEVLMRFGNGNSFLQQLDAPKRKALCQRLKLTTWDAMEVVVRKGAPASSLFIVLSGEVELRDDPAGVEALPDNDTLARFLASSGHDTVLLARTAGAGEEVGEREVLHKQPWATTIVASRPTELIEIQRVHLDAIIREVETELESAPAALKQSSRKQLQSDASARRASGLSLQRVHMMRDVLEFVLAKHPALKALVQSQPEAQAHVVPLLFQLRQFARGEIIFKPGDEASEVFFMMAGDVAVSQSAKGRAIVSRGLGGHFGDVAVLRKTPRDLFARAAQRCRLLSISASHFLMLLENGSPEAAAAWTARTHMVDSVVALQELSSRERSCVAYVCGLERVPRHRNIVEAGQPSDRCVVLLRGSCELRRPGALGTVGGVSGHGPSSRPAALLAAGELFAELDQSHFTHTLRATSDTVAIATLPTSSLPLLLSAESLMAVEQTLAARQQHRAPAKDPRMVRKMLRRRPAPSDNGAVVATLIEPTVVAGRASRRKTKKARRKLPRASKKSLLVLAPQPPPGAPPPPRSVRLPLQRRLVPHRTSPASSVPVPSRPAPPAAGGGAAEGATKRSPMRRGHESWRSLQQARQKRVQQRQAGRPVGELDAVFSPFAPLVEVGNDVHAVADSEGVIQGYIVSAAE